MKSVYLPQPGGFGDRGLYQTNHISIRTYPCRSASVTVTLDHPAERWRVHLGSEKMTSTGNPSERGIGRALPVSTRHLCSDGTSRAGFLRSRMSGVRWPTEPSGVVFFSALSRTAREPPSPPLFVCLFLLLFGLVFRSFHRPLGGRRALCGRSRTASRAASCAQCAACGAAS